MGEEWRSTIGHVGYQISSLGRVRSVDRVQLRSNGTRQTLRGKVLTADVLPNGYHVVTLDRRQRRYVAHLVLEAFDGPRPDGQEACHGPNGQDDNGIANLRWDTHAANTRDKRRDGTDHNVNRECCPWEHSLVAPNLTARSVREGRRSCLACHRARAAHRGDDEATIRSAADRRYQLIMAGGVSDLRLLRTSTEAAA